MMSDTSKPPYTTIVENPVGLLNLYEYTMSYNGTTFSNGYLTNGLDWWTLTQHSTSSVWAVLNTGNANGNSYTRTYGVRPSINLKSNVHIIDGDGTIDNPYRLNGDKDINLSGTLLSSRYSGEYIRFGNNKNNLYRIVSHENGTGTKIVSSKPLKSSDMFITSAFWSSNGEVNYSTNNVIGKFLNGEYLTNYVGDDYINMIEDSSTWYLGAVGNGGYYKLAKYIDTAMSGYATSVEAKVGLLRLGELMASQFEKHYSNESTTGLTTIYWLLTPYNLPGVWTLSADGGAAAIIQSRAYGVRPSLNLKSNVIITGGDGTKNNPFEIALQ